MYIRHIRYSNENLRSLFTYHYYYYNDQAYMHECHKSLLAIASVSRVCWSNAKQKNMFSLQFENWQGVE